MHIKNSSWGVVMFSQRGGLMGRGTGIAALAAMGIALVASSASAETILASDYANSYSTPWANGSNESTNNGSGVSFGAWTLFGEGPIHGSFIGTAGSQWSNYSSSSLYSSGVAFGVYAEFSANSSSYENAYRSLNANLSEGESLSLSIGFSFDNGNKGIDLFSGTTNQAGDKVFNFNINSSGYSWTGGGTATMTPWNDGSPVREAGVVINFDFTKTASGFDYSFASPQDGNLSGSGSLSGEIRTMQFYVSDAGGGDGGNLYFNNLVVVPEPTTAPLVIFGLLVPAVVSYRKIRRGPRTG